MASLICFQQHLCLIQPGTQLLDSKALTRVQSAVLIAIIVVAAVAGSVAYVVSSGTGQSKEAIKIGICADIDNTVGNQFCEEPHWPLNRSMPQGAF